MSFERYARSIAVILLSAALFLLLVMCAFWIAVAAWKAVYGVG